MKTGIQTKLTKYEHQQKAIADHRARMGQLRHYLNPDAGKFACARALVQIALEELEEARAIYANIIEVLWDLPGCQVVADEGIRYRKSTRRWVHDFVKVMESKVAPMPDVPEEWRDVCERHKDNPDFQLLLERIADLIYKGFNRKVDIDNEAPKVLAENSPYLIASIAHRSLIDWCEMELAAPGSLWAAGDRYKTLIAADTGKYYDLQHIMTGDPPPGDQREAKHNIIATYKDYDFTLHHYKKYLKDAEHWYGSRVNPGSIELYLDKLANEKEEGANRDRIQTDIALCDVVTGWPRKWRK